MGQTLTHGVYLPDEGERNCYSGLAANWSILDGAVGTVAEHTTALAGKAPAVHTHTKADITDLFNSANTWGGDNTYSKTVAIERSTDTGNFLALKNTVAELGSTPASATPVTIAFRDKDNDNLGYMGVYYDTDGSNHFRLYVRNKYTSGAPSTTGSYDYAFFGLRLNADKSKEGIIKASFRPYDNNTHDLGSSSYQWNNLYAKNYYYNGVAWGLDKANVWTRTNYFTKDFNINSEAAANTQSALSGSKIRQIVFNDSNNSNYFFRFRQYVDATSSRMQFNAQGFDSNNQAYSATFVYRVNSDGSAELYPGDNNQSLGTSNNKWKSLNGVNPGALSFPKIGTTENTDYIDVSGNIDLSVTASQSFVAPATGWFCISFKYDKVTSCRISAFNLRGDCVPIGSDGYVGCYIPVTAGVTVTVRVNATAIYNARIYLCQGNV